MWDPCMDLCPPWLPARVARHQSPPNPLRRPGPASPSPPSPALPPRLLIAGEARPGQDWTRRGLAEAVAASRRFEHDIKLASSDPSHGLISGCSARSAARPPFPSRSSVWWTGETAWIGIIPGRERCRATATSRPPCASTPSATSPSSPP